MPGPVLLDARSRACTSPRIEIEGQCFAVIEGQRVHGRQVLDGNPFDGRRLGVGLAYLVMRCDDEVEGNVLTIFMRAIRSRVDSQEAGHYSLPRGLFSQLAQDALTQRLVPVQKASRQSPLAAFHQMRRASHQEEGAVLLHHGMDDHVTEQGARATLEEAV